MCEYRNANLLVRSVVLREFVHSEQHFHFSGEHVMIELSAPDESGLGVCDEFTQLSDVLLRIFTIFVF